MTGLIPVESANAILPAHRGTAIDRLSRSHNLGQTLPAAGGQPQLLISTCMDHRKVLVLPNDPGPMAPRIYGSPWLVGAGFLCIGVLWGWVYAWIAAAWPGPWWKRGLRFGVVGWALMVPWFEFYLPWNVLLEPAALVALEMVCWAGVLLGVGLAIAGVEAALSRREMGRMRGAAVMGREPA